MPTVSASAEAAARADGPSGGARLGRHGRAWSRCPIERDRAKEMTTMAIGRDNRKPRTTQMTLRLRCTPLASLDSADEEKLIAALAALLRSASQRVVDVDGHGGVNGREDSR
ncbi:MAG: hypothetical protein L6Q76_24255 [Polyangiaceae bacterium]|nr:hypothetical protein [Polyangiaceae bacterium]